MDPTLGAGKPTDVWCCWKKNRPGEFMTAFEDRHGTYIMNSRDLRAVEARRALTKMGVHSLKIEGRTKSFYYCARTAQVYRQGHRRCGGWPSVRSDPDGHPREPGPPRLHRGLPAPSQPQRIPELRLRLPVSDTQQFVGEITGRNGDMVEVEVKNKFLLGATA